MVCGLGDDTLGPGHVQPSRKAMPKAVTLHLWTRVPRLADCLSIPPQASLDTGPNSQCSGAGLGVPHPRISRRTKAWASPDLHWRGGGLPRDPPAWRLWPLPPVTDPTFPRPPTFSLRPTRRQLSHSTFQYSALISNKPTSSGPEIPPLSVTLCW
jgi:hypothetical protein